MNNGTVAQFFVNELKCSFNLREPKSDRPTLLYMVCRVRGRQYKFSTGLKIYARHWQPSRQRAMTDGPGLTLADHDNNTAMNRRIELMISRFEAVKRKATDDRAVRNDFAAHLRRTLSDSEEEHVVESAIYMAFSRLYPSEQTTEGTLQTNRSRLRRIIDFLRCKGLGKLNQETVERFRNYLDDAQTGVKRINECCALLKRLINEAATMDAELSERINPVVYKPIKDRRHEDDSRRSPLLPEEAEALRKVGLSAAEDGYRRLFLLQMATGIRKSDLHTLLTSNPGAGADCVTITTRKEGIKATVMLTDEIRLTISDFQQGRLGQFDFGASFATMYNRMIKRIARKAGLTRTVIWKEQRGRHLQLRSARLCDVLTSHYARHTFITERVREGWNAGILRLVTGHADETMIRRVYTHLTEQDRSRMVMAERRRIE